MAFNVVVPELSESVVEATVSDWLKQEGDSVQAGEVVVILETDKVSLEVAAEQSGVISSIKQEEGADVTPGEVLCVVEPSDGASPEQTDDNDDSKSEADKSSEKEQAEPQPEPEKSAAKQPDEEKPDEQRITPVARRYAEAHDVDISQVKSSGGRVTREDVESHINQQKQTASGDTEQPARQKLPPLSGETRREERIRLSRRRQTIARRLVEVQQTAAMLTTFNEIDMHAVMELRKRRKEAFKEKHGVSLGLSSFFVKAVIGALKAFPRLNGEIQDKEMVLKHYYDIGIAIGAEEGLVVPVLRDADRMTFAEIETQIRQYASQVNDGTLPIEALRGGTFTITNGGVFGSMMSTPILNPPQVGILGLHAITERPVVVDGEMVIRPMMYVAVTYDHRIVDGRESVQFLYRVKELIEDPERLLLEG